MKISSFFKLGLFALILGVSSGSSAGNQLDFSGHVKEAAYVQKNTENGLGVEDKNLTISINSILSSDLTASVSIKSSLPKDTDLSYYLGYSEGDVSLKPMLGYNVQTIDNKIVTRETGFNIINKHLPYDTLGKLNEVTLTHTVDIPLLPGEKVLTDDFYVYNYFKVTYDESTKKYTVSKDEKGNPISSYVSTIEKVSSFRDLNLNSFVDVSYQGYSTYNGHTSIEFDAKNNMTADIYKSLSLTTRNAYNQNELLIEEGRAHIRTRFNLSSTSLVLTHQDGTETKKPIVNGNIEVSTVEVLAPSSKMIFVFNDIDMSTVTDVRFDTFFIYVDIYDHETFKFIVNTQYAGRFGPTALGMKELVNGSTVVEEGAKDTFSTDLNLVFIITMASYIAVYLIISFGFFVYLSKKYANDEFRKMRPKQYWKTNFMGLLTIGSLILTFMSIALRWTVFNNSIAIYNPLDIIVIAFSVASIILVGYFIKYFATQIKNIIDKNRIEKLKLNANSIDDGTLIIPTKANNKE